MKNSLRIHKWTHNEFNIFILGVLTHPHAKGSIYIQAWASALLVLTVMGITRASMRGTSDESSTLFSYT